MARRRKLKTGLETMFEPSTEGEAAESEAQNVAEVLVVPDDAAALAAEASPGDAATPPDESAVAAEAVPPDAPPAVVAGEEGAQPLPEPDISLEAAAGQEMAAPSRADEVVSPVDEEAEEAEGDLLFAADMAAAATEAEAVGAERQLVILGLADEWYGVDIAAVEQIIEPQRITPVPNTPPYIAGLTNLRGTVLPVVDLRRRLNLPASGLTQDTRIMVAQIHRMQVGMIVDTVTEVLRVPERVIEPPSPLVTSVDSMYISGIARIAAPHKGGDADRLIVLLDLEQILPNVPAR